MSRRPLTAFDDDAQRRSKSRRRRRRSLQHRSLAARQANAQPNFQAKRAAFQLRGEAAVARWYSATRANGGLSAFVARQLRLPPPLSLPLLMRVAAVGERSATTASSAAFYLAQRCRHVLHQANGDEHERDRLVRERAIMAAERGAPIRNVKRDRAATRGAERDAPSRLQPLPSQNFASSLRFVATMASAAKSSAPMKTRRRSASNCGAVHQLKKSFDVRKDLLILIGIRKRLHMQI